MNSCKHCGKEIPEGRKFCNPSCAAKYNNAHRKPFHWSKEKLEAYKIRKRIQNDEKRKSLGQEPRYTPSGKVKERRCKYCGTPLKGSERICCAECRRYSKLPLYQKLGILEGPLKERYFKALEILKDLYFVQKLSAPLIWRKTGVNFRTMRDLFEENGIKTRNIAESNRVALEEGRVQLGKLERNQYKHGWHETWEGNRVYYRSSYELEFAQELDTKRIPYEMESQKIRYFDSELEIERIAIPDFYLPETNELVEIKSRYTYKEQNMKDKFKAYREHGFKPKLYLERKELEI